MTRVATLLLLLAIATDIGTSEAQLVTTRRKELSDDDIIEALAILLSEVDKESVLPPESVRLLPVTRNGRQNGEFGSFDEFGADEPEFDRASGGRQLARQDFEEVLGTCTTTGYEVRYHNLFILRRGWCLIHLTARCLCITAWSWMTV